MVHGRDLKLVSLLVLRRPGCGGDDEGCCGCGRDGHHGDRATAASGDNLVAEYTRDGISAAGLRHVVQLFAADLLEDATTSDLCQAFLKPRTVPPGWADEAVLIDPANRWYKHNYRRAADSAGEAQSAPPTSTQSFCRLLAADPATARFVGRPTHFLSHNWGARSRNLVEAVSAFAAAQPEDSPEAFFCASKLSMPARRSTLPRNSLTSLTLHVPSH